MTNPTPSIQQLHATVADDFAAVNRLIPSRLTSDVALVEAISQYIVESGGKRLRPLLVLLGARACGYHGSGHVLLAGIIEFLHTATLLHDDVIDHSALRRGRATANAIWGNTPSVLVGDYLYSRAFQMMVELDSMPIIAILADATNVIAQGEVMQIDHVGNPDTTEARYMDVIRAKTAMLFEASAHTAGVLAAQSADDPHVAALRDYGMQLGLAYQIVDDLLDYAGNAAEMGKNVGDDLAEGKVTMPLIAAMRSGSAEDVALLRAAVESRSADRFDDVICAVRRSGALDYTRQRAEEHARLAARALDVLPESPYRSALCDLTELVIRRTS